MLAADTLKASGHELETRPPDPGRDRVDDAMPQLVVVPRTGEAVAAALQWAAANRLSVVIRGRGSKSGWGARPGPVDVLLDLSMLNRILAHQAGDLTATVEAGIRLRDLNAALAPHRQWLALDPPFAEHATIGGLIASNDSGPQRHRFGAPRDLVIGIQLATVDGRIAKAGGQVVKNVAGYDLSKIISGSFGSLAAIVAATFKLAPLPEASMTVAIDRLDPDGLAAVTDAIAKSQLEPVAFDVSVEQRASAAAPAIGCLIRFASFTGVVLAESANAAAQVARFHPSVTELKGEAEREAWTRQARRPWEGTGSIVRLAWRPGEVKQMLAALMNSAPTRGFELAGRLGVGSGLARLEGTDSDQREAVERLRGSDVVGNVVVVRAPLELRTRDFVWGRLSNAALLSNLKRELDPAGTLGAQRGPV